jgi:two-component system sensor histidine kinase TtrS
VDPGLRLDVDRHALLQALQNLLQNAVESYRAGEGGPVRVEAREIRSGSEVEINVVDRGAGISDEAKARLFVPFASEKAGGTGVGLSIARSMVEEVHGGELLIESAPGEGTVVKLVLPVRQAGVRAATGSSAGVR